MGKIAMVVGNPCAPDSRVIKQAEFLASQGHSVRIYCTVKAGIPLHEVVNGVEYFRIRFSIPLALKKVLPFRKNKRDAKRKHRINELIAQNKNFDD